jgi:hypothetical protein
MPKRLAEFTTDDWLRLRPFTQHLKTLRYDANNALHIRKPVRSGDIAAVIRSLKGRRVLITVAFEDPNSRARSETRMGSLELASRSNKRSDRSTVSLTGLSLSGLGFPVALRSAATFDMCFI